MDQTDIITIQSLGARGDGMSEQGQAIAFALPGEKVRPGPPLEVLEASDQRVAPPCQHYGTCGGCALQHLALPPYQDWKRTKVADTLSQRGIDFDVEPTFGCAPGERRRAQFAARRTETGLRFGYHQSGSKMIFDVLECPVLTPTIVSALPTLKELADIACPKAGELKVAVFATDLGLDVCLSGATRLADGVRRRAVDFALKSGLPRLSLGDEILIEREAPTVRFGGFPVSVQPGGFAQATQRAEAHMVELATQYMKGCKQVADLFAGAGTFSIPLALQSKVAAYESEPAALTALDKAARQAPKLGVRIKTLTTERRDLHRRPLTARDLKRVDGVVFDPPRAGAEAQCKELAKSPVRKIVGVSCNPATFA
ncbi:MAG: RNA methyltransferase, partial [Pseudomonadota bacterium]